jgi:hypothetical protein
LEKGWDEAFKALLLWRRVGMRLYKSFFSGRFEMGLINKKGVLIK